MSTVKVAIDRFRKLVGLSVDHSKHSSFSDGHCAMELLAHVTGSEHTDHPACTSNVLANVTRALNDSFMGQAGSRQRAIRPILHHLLGTNTTREDEAERTRLLLVHFLGDHLASWARLTGRAALAADLQSLAATSLAPPDMSAHARILIHRAFPQGISPEYRSDDSDTMYLQSGAAAVMNGLLNIGVEDLIDVCRKMMLEVANSGREWEPTTACLLNATQRAIIRAADIGRTEIEFVDSFDNAGAY